MNRFKTILVLGGLIVLLGGTAYYLSRNMVPAGSLQPSPRPESGIGTDLTLYTHPTLGYTLNIPDTLEVSPSGTDIQIIPRIQEPGPGPANFLYVSVVTPAKKESVGEVYNYNPQDYAKLQQLDIGESISLAAAGFGQEEWFTYTRVDDVEIGGLTALRFENTKPWEFPSGTTETRYMLETGNTIYILGSYTGGDSVGVSAIDPRTAHGTLLSFRPGTVVASEWKTYTSDVHGFTISYPPDITHEANQEGERFFKLGTTQSLGTELYDGISVIIRSGTYDDLSFDAFVLNKHEESVNDPVQPEVGEITDRTVAGIRGKAYTVSSLGERTVIYLPAESGSYLEIIDGTVQPTNQVQSFRETVDAMLATLRMRDN